MISNRFVRYATALLLGALAGVSLCISVLPLALQASGVGDELALGFYLKRYALHAALIMAVGGWSVTRVRHPLAGALVFGPAGLVTALYLATIGLGRDPRAMAAAAISGLVYGLLGGLILGRVLARPAAPPPDEPDPHETTGLP